MAEISNKALALLVLAALLTVVVATGVQLQRLNSASLTGFATSDTGDVQLSIAAALNIEVDANNDTINFGTCTPQPGITFTADTNDTSGSNCTGDTATPQFIQVLNIGNVNARLNVTGECTIAQFLPQSGSSPNSTDFAVKSAGAGCQAGNVTYTPLSNSPVTLCTNLTSGANNDLQMYARVNITADALTPNCGATPETNTLTFSATIAS